MVDTRHSYVRYARTAFQTNSCSYRATPPLREISALLGKKHSIVEKYFSGLTSQRSCTSHRVLMFPLELLVPILLLIIKATDMLGLVPTFLSSRANPSARQGSVLFPVLIYADSLYSRILLLVNPK